MGRSSSRQRAAVAAAWMSLGADVLAAEPPPAPPPAPAARPAVPIITEIVVTGSRPRVETRIDRRVYAISGDIQGDMGSAADVLRNIPSVSVDLEGNPSLRGDSDVQILIDGRFRPEYNGPNKGAALEALTAQGIDRIEVLTNPPASFRREGSAGIINIITKRSSADRSASVQTGIGSNGRWNVGGNGSVRRGDLSMRGAASVRHDLRQRDIHDRRTVRDDSGAVLNEREQHTDTRDDRVSKKASLGVDYDLGAKDRLSAEASYYRRDSDGVLEETTRLLDGAGTTLGQYGRERRANDYDYSGDTMLRYHHAGAGGDDGLTIELQRSEGREHPAWEFQYAYAVPEQPDLFQSQHPREHEVTTELGIDFAITTSDKQRFTAGYDLEVDDQTSDHWMSIPVTSGGAEVPDPAFTNTFRDEQAVHALYATYERPFGDWTALAGLRLEATSIDLRQVTNGERDRQNYLRAYPSLHLSRKLNDRQTLTFSYARRVRRPWSQQLNPFVVQIDPTYFRSGNPDLKPSEIDSLDLAWNYDVGSTSFSASVYGRRRYDVATDVRTLIGPTAELERPENLGDNRSGGLEITASGKLGGAFGYNLAADVFYDEIDAGNLGFAGTRSTITRDGKAALDWRIGDRDRLQVGVTTMGRRLTPQGYRLGGTTMDLGYRHTLGNGLSVSATLSDVFASKQDRLVLDTPELSERLTTRPQGRILWLGLTWSRTGGQDKFDYEQ